MTNRLLRKDVQVKLITVFVFAILAAVFIFVFSVHELGSESILDVMFKIRGGRGVSQDIVLLYIDSETIEQLGGWPITRDYYAYMIYILEQSGARAVGFDILLDSPHRRYPEFDQALSEILRETDNVCLAMNFKHLEQNGPGLLLAHEPRTAVPGFQRYTCSGFSNLSSQTMIRRLPLLVSHQDSLYPSFALQLARLMLNPELEYRFSGDVFLTANEKQVRIPTDARGRLWLNRLRQRCVGLRPDEILRFDLRNNRVCDLDNFQSMDDFTHAGSISGNCILGSFMPVTPEQAEAIEVAFREARGS